MDTQQDLGSIRSFPAAVAGGLTAAEASTSRTVLIVGAGFSGTAVAIQLLRLPHPQPLRIVLVERAAAVGGVAYAQRATPYLLNVPAGRMSASGADPLEFLRYAQQNMPQASAADFLPRALYGQYLESTLRSAQRSAPPHVRLQRVRGEVIALEKLQRTSTLRAWLEDGDTIVAHSVVLATGNPAPAPLPGSEQLPGGRYLADPWQSEARLRPGETILVAGSGLTMADVVLAGQEAAQGLATVHAISRHGLLPARQEEPLHVHAETPQLAETRGATLSLRRLVRQVRELAASAQRCGGDWRAVVTAVRGAAPALWQGLTVSERGRFLRHVRAYWDVHRHRLPPVSSAALDELRSNGRLHIHAGRILALQPAGSAVAVTWRARGTNCSTTLLVDRVVNCTGPRYDLAHTRERLLRSLLAQGVAVADPLGIGIATDAFGGLIDAGGRIADNLYYIGPLLRPRHWETTAVGELRLHAEQLAWHLAMPRRQYAARRP
jgi:uncharacterized NAD(P)/FAD-binding protein YdhS